MSLLQSILMGLIQGLTEFLPVSSSGHLALFKILFDVNTETGLLFDVMLHVGTLVAICIVYYKDIIRLVIEFIGMLIDGGYNLVTWMQKRRGKDGAYRHVIYNSYRKMVMLVIVSTIPTGIIGYVGADLVTAASEVLIVPGICLTLRQRCCLSVTGYRKGTRNQNRPVMPTHLLSVSVRALQHYRDFPVPELRSQPVC